MNAYLLPLMIFTMLFMGCKNPNQSAIDPNKEKTSALEITSEDKDMAHLSLNRQVADTIDGGMMLLGPINAMGLKQEPYSVWLEDNSNAYNPDRALIEEIKPLIKSCYVKVFMGSWCEDSQREVPALLKLLKMTDFDSSQLEIIAMTHDKDTPENYEEGYAIEFIPTIMFFKDGAELNRIVEYTQETLELDVLKILKQHPYTPAYAE
jgi:thiol-disulfide isomerase/thioredoxin